MFGMSSTAEAVHIIWIFPFKKLLKGEKLKMDKFIYMAAAPFLSM